MNIDHVATIRNARGETYPDPLKAALLAQKSGADSITIHLREDRRHIRDKDLKNIKKKIRIFFHFWCDKNTFFLSPEARVVRRFFDKKKTLLKYL